MSWPSGSRRHIRRSGHGTDPALSIFDLLSYSVRNRLRWGIRLFVKQFADDRCSGKFRCTWTVRFEDSEECKFIGGFLSLFFRAFLSLGFASVLISLWEASGAILDASEAFGT
uniref:Uncharacterized protein n=1 Tax=Heterorhabditis bacteriophora TaxID=37862 RepID=A0A1I7WL21_HETBA